MSDGSRLDAMNFLNEATSRFPNAISFAAGRPADQTFEKLSLEYIRDLLDIFQRYRRSVVGERSRSELFQYGSASGSINELVCQQLRLDDRVLCSPADIVITSGCQEALALCLSELCQDESEVVLVCNPCYIGISGAARATKVKTFSLSNNLDDLSNAISQACEQLDRADLKAKAIYLVPDFDNPTGRVVDEEQRLSIIEICARRKIAILEDNPYGLFRYRGDPVKTLYELDREGCVLYLSTYSKTICPALRVGSITFPTTLFGDKNHVASMRSRLVQRKSFLTVNTGQFSQAIIGGLLIKESFSLRKWIQPAMNAYRRNLAEMKFGLSTHFDGMRHCVSWNDPAGGFFLTMNLPFEFDAVAVETCAEEYGVILMPMSFFSCDKSQDHCVRLSFSGVEHRDISEGLRRFSSYAIERLTLQK